MSARKDNAPHHANEIPSLARAFPVRPLALILVLLAPVLVAGCLNTFEEPQRPHFIRIVGVDVQPTRVLAQSVVLNVSSTLDNRGGAASGQLRLEAKAYAEDTGFLIAQNASDVGTIAPDKTRSVPILLTVPRTGSVRIDVALYEDDLGRERASITARNLGALEPDLLDTGLRVSGVDFLVRGVDNSTGTRRATIQTDLSLTNEGASASEDLQVQVKAREVTTSLIADVQWLTTGTIRPGTTAVRSVNLTVPDGYNYEFEILTWRGDVVIARNAGDVQLAPTFVKPKDTEVVTSTPNVNDFVSPTYATPGSYGVPPYATAPTPKVPGFTPFALALAVALALVGRRMLR